MEMEHWSWSTGVGAMELERWSWSTGDGAHDFTHPGNNEITH